MKRNPCVRRLEKKLKTGVKRLSEMRRNDNLPVADNYHLIHRAVAEVRKTLRRADGLCKGRGGLPRLYEYVYGLVRADRGRVGLQTLDSYLDGIASNIELTGSEIACVPDTVRAALCLYASENDDKTVLDNVFSSLRAVNEYACEDLYGKLSRCEEVLCEDPFYARMDRKSRDLFRHRVSVIAQKTGRSEAETAAGLCERAKKEFADGHIGHLLFPKRGKSGYVTLSYLLPPVFAALLGATVSWWLCPLTLLPFFGLTRCFLDRVYAFLFRPDPLPAMDTEKECPKTLVTFVTVASDEKDAEEIVSRMETAMHANRTEGLYFGALVDLPESDAALSPSDRSVTETLRAGVETLNFRYGPRFFAAVRRRVPQKNGRWGSDERKRGAILDFLDVTRDTGREKFYLLTGDIGRARYFCALDSDTRPGIGSVARLVGVLEHPLSAPVLNGSATAVVSGYGIAAPRMEGVLPRKNAGLFRRITGTQGGTELYGNPSFSLWQDVYGEGIFAGKGVIRIDLFLRLMKGAFPPGRVLSHDILEGGFMRCAYVSDTVFYDDAPAHLVSYGKRAHRWIRGDVQNLPFLRRDLVLNGKTVRNPLSVLSRVKLLDNLLRALLFPALFLLILSSAFFGAYALLPALVYLFFPFFDAVAGLLAGVNVNDVPYRYEHAPSYPAAAFLRCLFDLAYLPFFAVTHTDAVVRAVSRLISGRNLMEWTTASDADRLLKNTVLKNARATLGQLVGLVGFFFFAGVPFGVLWAAAYLTAVFYRDPRPKQETVCVDGCLADMWAFFAEFLTEKDHYLIPDNFQEQPLRVTAHRTSPTNIGLAMLCCLGACDAGLISREKMLELVEKQMASVESLAKWNGHLYNWYDTETAAPLTPRFVSSVDNGNFAVCLYTLKNGLTSLGDTRASALAARIEALLASTDFSLLYHKGKDLFSIGFDVEKGEYADSYYDLYASESRLLSFFCVATGQVPLRHWRTLGRFCVVRHGRLGVKSWSGTAFEYFMPTLFWEPVPGSLEDEMLAFALRAQTLHAKGRPFGVSESGFYAFDPGLTYRYRAFGTPSLALRRDKTSDDVVASYATFLMMPYAPRLCKKNLDMMKNDGLYGKYGYYEAVDRTPSRAEGKAGIVRSYMAHHVGMSFLACVNLTCGNIMRRRFADAPMRAFLPLTEEKLPSCAPRYREAPPARKTRRLYVPHPAEVGLPDPARPVARGYGNERFASVISDVGTGYLRTDECDLTRRRTGEDPTGFYALYRTDGKVLSLTYAPLFDPFVTYKTTFGDDECTFMSRRRDLEGRMSVTVGTSVPCEVREIVLKNDLASVRDGTLLLYTEPTLEKTDREISHPAFAGLFVEAFYEDGLLLFRRRKRSETDGDRWLCFGVSEPFDFCVSRFEVLERTEGKKSLLRAFDKPFGNTTVPVDPCAALRIRLPLEGHEIRTVTVVSAFGRSKREAADNARTALGTDFASLRASHAAYVRALHDQKHITREAETLCGLLCNAVFDPTRRHTEAEFRNRLGRESLYRLGLGTDLPVIAVRTDGDSAAGCESFMRAFSAMRARGLRATLVFCFSDGGRYDCPVRTALTALLDKNGISADIGREGGVLLVNTAGLDDLGLVASVSCFYADLERGWAPEPPARRALPPRLSDGSPVPVTYVYKTGVGGFTETGFAADDKDLIPSLPAWCHVIASPSFGTVVSDSSLGFTFARSAQQNRLTPWSNDPVRGCTGERMRLSVRGRTYDVIRSGSFHFEKGAAHYASVCGSCTVRVSVFVPDGCDAKIMRAEIRNDGEDFCSLSYEADILLGERLCPARPLLSVTHRALFYRQPLSAFSADGTAFVTGADAVLRDGRVTALCAGRSSQTSYFILGYGDDAGKARALAGRLCSAAYCEEILEADRRFRAAMPFLKITTGDVPIDLFCNTFLFFQVLTSRLYARTGFYQCSGAFGFRDQLQDAGSLLLFDDKILRDQLLLCASRQFEQGDVLHWWHENAVPCGVRTRSSDDLLWLPLMTAEYIETTRDVFLLRRRSAYLTAPELDENESERYLMPAKSDRDDDLYGHCRMALHRACRTGAHGLILMGSGDWNDGMTGYDGGESVFSTMLCIVALRRFADVASLCGDETYAARCRSDADALAGAVEAHAWNGRWYLRAFARDGHPVGTEGAEECEIDLLPQAFAAFCGLDRGRVYTALQSAEEKLVDTENRLVRLFTPPFKDGAEKPGYIKGYIAGVRENGGQYTHAAVWYALALLSEGLYDKAYGIFSMLCPVTHSLTPADVKRYRAEPYVLAGDVYDCETHRGMAGWTHYTGSAGWFLRVLTTGFLGLCRRGDKLFVRPHLPSSVPSLKLTARFGTTDVTLTVSRGFDASFEVDGLPSDHIPLDGGTHSVTVTYVNLMSQM